jgi:hypothetical protein
MNNKRKIKKKLKKRNKPWGKKKETVQLYKP